MRAGNTCIPDKHWTFREASGIFDFIGNAGHQGYAVVCERFAGAILR
jgi:hypothetical protein